MRVLLALLICLVRKLFTLYSSQLAGHHNHSVKNRLIFHFWALSSSSVFDSCTLFDSSSLNGWVRSHLSLSLWHGLNEPRHTLLKTCTYTKYLTLVDYNFHFILLSLTLWGHSRAGLNLPLSIRDAWKLKGLQNLIGSESQVKILFVSEHKERTFSQCLLTHKFLKFVNGFL